MIRFETLSYTYPGREGQPALGDVSLHVATGECVVLCGRSGCGKTTLLRAANGLIPHFYEGTLQGSVTVAGMEIAVSTLPQIAQVVGSVFQNPRTQFFHMDTTGELAFQLENQNMPREEMRRRVRETARALELEQLLDRDIFALSGGEKQQIACGSAWAARPRVVVLDEPSSNLDLPAIRRLQQAIATMKAAGATILVSEHRLWYLYGIADRYVLLEDGRMQREYLPAEIAALSQRERERLGLRDVCLEQLFVQVPSFGQTPGADVPGLEVQSLICRRGKRQVLSIPELSIPKGAVVAVVGENGAGKSTLLLCLCGLLRHKGEIRLERKQIPQKHLPQTAYLVMQEAGHQLFSDTVLGELQLGNPGLTEEEALDALQSLGLDGLEDLHPGSLSGGQQQRLSLAVARYSARRLMLYDEPTSGQDGENLCRTASLIQKANENAACTLMVSHDPELILRCATHLLVIHKGEVKDLVNLDEAGEEAMWRVFGEEPLYRHARKGCHQMNNASVWEQLVRLPYLPLYEKVVNAALELDVCSHLTAPVTAEELAQSMGWHVGNTGYFLSALTALGFVEQKDGKYQNTPESQKYLVKGSPEYLGGFILFYGQNEGMVPMDVKTLLEKGPQPMPQMEMEQNLDFAQYGQMLRLSEEGYRQQEILRIVRSLPENGAIRRVLDVGCAAGLLGLAVIGDAPERSGVLLDQIPPSIVQSSVDRLGLAGRAQVVQANFLTDPIGEGYDLILAVSVMLFAKGNMEALMKKFYDALNPGGVLLVVSEGVAPDLSAPWDMVTGYLPYYLNGMDMAVKAGEIPEASRKAGFTQAEPRIETLCSGIQEVHVIRK